VKTRCLFITYRCRRGGTHAGPRAQRFPAAHSARVSVIATGLVDRILAAFSSSWTMNFEVRAARSCRRGGRGATCTSTANPRCSFCILLLTTIPDFLLLIFSEPIC